MPADFVALAIAHPSPSSCELAAVVAEPGGDRSLLFLVGYDEPVARARAHAETAETVAVANLDEAGQLVLEAAGEAPWVTFELDEELAAWAEASPLTLPTTVLTLDAGELAALVHPAAAARRLGEFLALFGEAGEPAPGLPTALAVARLWRAAGAAIGELPYALRQGVSDLLARGRHPLATVWQAAADQPRAETEPERLETLLGQRLATLTPPASEPAELPETRPIDPAAVAELFAADGPLARVLGNWERRDGQVTMTRAVAEVLGGGQCLLVEAGTGTGKSLAYLAPAVRFALANQTPVVVSTNTKNLQDQLCRKDLPLLREALGVEFRAELIKGRANYLCVTKLLDELADVGLLPFDEHPFYLAVLASWAATTTSGDIDELSPYLTWRYPRLLPLARRLTSDSETCTAASARSHPCFATVARRRALAADLLVINHALALANATVEVLPPFRHLIFDEAHNLEEIATEAFGLELDRRRLLGLARELGASRDGRALTNRCRTLLTPSLGGDELRVTLTEVDAAVAAVGEAVEAFGEIWGGVVLNRLGRSLEELTHAEKLRLDPSVYTGALGESLHAAGENLRERLGEVVKGLTAMVTGLQGLEGEAVDSAELQALRVAAQARLQEWSDQLRTLALLLELADERFVYWLEFVLRTQAWEWRLKAAPIDAGEALAEQVLSRMEAVVLTSATLTVDGRFDYFADRLGLRCPSVAERADTLAVPSHFDYARQVLLGLPVNIAYPQEERFESHVCRAIEDVTRLLDGRTLILFTATGSLRRCYDRLAERLRAIGLEPLCQGVSGARHALADRFRRNPHSVLFGTRSFWEGIDVPGDALQCVIIVKLPFTVPDEPVHAARCEQLKARGRDAWSGYSVPQAVILFKQGFGRLIRTATDRGAVIVLDRRLCEKSYGRAFLRSVPGYHGVFDTWAEVKASLQDWFATEPVGGRGERGAR